MTTIPKSIAVDQLPENNLLPLKLGDSITYITYKLRDNDYFACDYIYLHERLGTVLEVLEDGSFIADMESISGKRKVNYHFTIKELNGVKFGPKQNMAHVLYKL